MSTTYLNTKQQDRINNNSSSAFYISESLPKTAPNNIFGSGPKLKRVELYSLINSAISRGLIDVGGASSYTTNTIPTAGADGNLQDNSTNLSFNSSSGFTAKVNNVVTYNFTSTGFNQTLVIDATNFLQPEINLDSSKTNGNTPADTELFGRIRFRSDGSTMAAIEAESVNGDQDAADTGSEIVFYTKEDAFSGNFERMRLKHNGRINISAIDEYADDTAAGADGLVKNDLYKTPTGELRIKL